MCLVFIRSEAPSINPIDNKCQRDIGRAKREGIEKSLDIIIVAPSGTIWGLFSGPDGCDATGSGVALRSFQSGGDWTTLNRCARDKEREREQERRNEEEMRDMEREKGKKKQKIGRVFSFSD